MTMVDRITPTPIPPEDAKVLERAREEWKRITEMPVNALRRTDMHTLRECEAREVRDSARLPRNLP